MFKNFIMPRKNNIMCLSLRWGEEPLYRSPKSLRWGEEPLYRSPKSLRWGEEPLYRSPKGRGTAIPRPQILPIKS